MADIELNVTNSYREDDINPVELSDGTVVKMNYVVDGEKKSMSGVAEKNEEQIAMLRMNPEGNRIFMQIDPLKDVPADTVVEILETFVAGIKLVLNL